MSPPILAYVLGPLPPCLHRILPCPWGRPRYISPQKWHGSLIIPIFAAVGVPWVISHRVARKGRKTGILRHVVARNRFRGLGVALITPFRQGGEIDREALLRLVEYQIKGGVDFLCIMGTTAETPCLTPDEKRSLRDTLVERVGGRVPLLLGVGGNCTANVVEEITRTDWRGIDGVLSVCPMYNKPSQQGLYEHFRVISQASPVPVVLYNVPGRTGVNMTAETTLRLATDFPDSIVAIKEASGNIPQVDDIIKNKPEGFDVLSGDDGITFPLLTLGAVGVVSVIANALPSEFSRMVRLTLSGDYAKALLIHHRFTELFKLLFVDGNPAGVKAMLHAMGMIENELRLPLCPTRLTTMERITGILKDLHLG